jgi:hypothetical protein
VDHFHHCGQRVMMRTPVTARLGGKKQERRAKPLATSDDDVFRDPSNQRDVRVQRIVQHAIDRLHVFAQNRLQQGNCHGGRQIG